MGKVSKDGEWNYSFSVWFLADQAGVGGFSTSEGSAPLKGVYDDSFNGGKLRETWMQINGGMLC